MGADADPQLEAARAAAVRGDVAGAVGLYRQVLGRDAGNAPAHFELSGLLGRAGQAGPSLAHLSSAVRLAPDNGAYHFALARRLAGAAQYDAAIRHYNRARFLVPSNVEAHVDAATLLEMRGEMREARHAITRALEAEPKHPRARALAMRLEFRTNVPATEDLEAWARDLREIAADPGGPLTRALALDLLIDVEEKRGAFDEAWDAIVACNETDRSMCAGSLPAPAHREGYLNMVRGFGAFMTRERGERYLREKPDDGLAAPALLVGFPRSGTTMTERALDAHPHVRSIEERPTFELARHQLGRIVGPGTLAAHPPPGLLDALTTDHVAQLRRAYWAHAGEALGADWARGAPSGEVVLDKMPLRIADLAFVARVFPEARVLVALRDPRDVVLSCYRQRLGYAGNIPMSFLLDLEGAARLYAEVMGAYLRTREAYVNPMMEIRYEETVADFEGRIRAMLGFLGLEWDERVLRFHERTDRLHNTPSYHAVQKKVSTGAVARWKRYEPKLSPVLPALAPFVSAFGYS